MARWLRPNILEITETGDEVQGGVEKIDAEIDLLYSYVNTLNDEEKDHFAQMLQITTTIQGTATADRTALEQSIAALQGSINSVSSSLQTNVANITTELNRRPVRDSNGKIIGDITGSASYAATAGYTAHGKMLFASNGTFVVPAGITVLWVSGIGGGGGGGGGGIGKRFTMLSSAKNGGTGGQGGSGQKIAFQQINVTPSASIAVTVGVGGAGGAPKGNGGIGGTTYFGNYISLIGGGGGGPGGDAYEVYDPHSGENGRYDYYNGSPGTSGTSRDGVSLLTYYGSGGTGGLGGVPTAYGDVPGDTGYTGIPGFVLVEW